MKTKITIEDYIKAHKKANREVDLIDNFSHNLCNKVHKSKKDYNRKINKQLIQEQE